MNRYNILLVLLEILEISYLHGCQISDYKNTNYASKVFINERIIGYTANLLT